MLRGLATTARYLARRAQHGTGAAFADSITTLLETSTSGVQGPGCCTVIPVTESPAWSFPVPFSQSRRSFASSSTATLSEPASASQTASGDLLIHPSAVQRLKQLQAQNPGQHVALRIEVEGGGCSGFQYKFSLHMGPPSETDKVFEAEGVQVLCDPDSLEMVRGSRVEFEDTLMRRAFVVGANPNSEASCGCGSSFTAKMPPITRPSVATR